MAWCLTAPSHYMNQCWLMNKCVHWHLPESSFPKRAHEHPWTYLTNFQITLLKLDESTARRQLKSPWSLSGRSIHLTLVTKWSCSWSWMTYCHPLCLCTMSIGPAILRYSNSRLTFNIQRSRLWSRSNPLVTFEPLEFNRYVCFSFHGNRTTFGWDIGNSIFALKNSRSRLWPRSNPLVTFEPLEFNRCVCISFRGNRTIFGWDMNKFHIWSWKI